MEQVIRPTGLIDPDIIVRPAQGQVDDLVGEISARVTRKERVLVTTLTKRMAEELTDYLGGLEMPASAPEWAKERRAESFEYLGRSLAAEGKHPEAVTALTEGLEIDPLRASLHQAMGQSLIEMNRLNDALRHW